MNSIILCKKCFQKKNIVATDELSTRRTLCDDCINILIQEAEGGKLLVNVKEISKLKKENRLDEIEKLLLG